MPPATATCRPSHPRYTRLTHHHTHGIPVSPVITPDGIPDIAHQQHLDALARRIEVLKKFVATFQQQCGTPVSPNGIPGVPRLTDGIPTTKHSFVIAADTLEAIQAFAASRHVQVKDALDLLVRTGLAAHGKAVGQDA
jgi:hypothetical protein